MAVYYIDFENVHDSGLEGLSQLTAKDKIILFYNKEQKISIDGMLAISNCKAKIEYRKTMISGRNYLDFQLATYLGYGINQYKNEKIYIISKDSGFDSIVHFWVQEGVDISRKKTIAAVAETLAVHEIPEVEPDYVITSTDGDTEMSASEEVVKPAKKRPGRKKAIKAEKEVESAEVAPETTEEVAPVKDSSLPERFRKKMRPILAKQGLSSLQYSKVYKAVVSIEKTKPFRKQLIADFGEELGHNIYEYTQHIFGEYWKSKQ